jgi:hypothetical protein
MYALNQASITATSAAGARTALVDPNVTLVTGAVGGATPGNIRDGVCLKCHVNIDPLSTQLAFDAVGTLSGTAADYTLKISGGHHPGAWTNTQVENVTAAWSTINPYSGAVSGGANIVTNGNNLLYTWR